MDRRRRVLEQAWIGDAVLSLFARRHILTEHGGVNSRQLELMTSNQFLAGIGEPSSVEAEIGRVYAEGGIEAAFGWIEEHLMPLYRRQEEKRQRSIKARSRDKA